MFHKRVNTHQHIFIFKSTGWPFSPPAHKLFPDFSEFWMLVYQCQCLWLLWLCFWELISWADAPSRCSQGKQNIFPVYWVLYLLFSVINLWVGSVDCRWATASGKVLCTGWVPLHNECCLKNGSLCMGLIEVHWFL